jgi:hypothetical protein
MWEATVRSWADCRLAGSWLETALWEVQKLPTNPNSAQVLRTKTQNLKALAEFVLQFRDV